MKVRHDAIGKVVLFSCVITALAVIQGTAAAQSSTPVAAPQASPTQSSAPAGVTSPDYVIGADDHLSVVFWHDKDMTADVVVRPDGKISLPLLNDIQAAGQTPEQLRAQVVEAASRYFEQPIVSVVVKEIHSRSAYITGKVTRPGSYVVTTGMNVMQMIALAGGLVEYADEKNIVVMRTEGGRQQYLPFNYKDVVEQRRPQQNIVLRPGDTIVVP